MVGKFTIDDAFIAQWHPKYDEKEHDEGEYQNIILEVSKEVSEIQTISKLTFGRILNWKAPRAKGKVKFENFDIYSKTMRDCLEVREEDKLAILDALPGIGVPVASTILHFLYPSHFPIIDIRTVETLYCAGYIKSKQIDQKRYGPFCDAILNIARRYPRWTLREIDRALFAYHKIELEPKLKRGDC